MSSNIVRCWDHPGVIDALRALWAQGYSASQIAKKLRDLGVTPSRNAVIGKAFRLGLDGRAKPASPMSSPRAPRAFKPPREKRPHAGRAVATTKLLPLQAPAAPIVFDAAQARLWTSRAFGQCAYPISGEGADTFSCCQPTEATYCAAHAAVMYVAPKDMGSRYARSLRRWVA